ncbi:Non-structural maintenance of chromosomes element 3 [Chionoecetes opilio]|uniref:Non-structural maintenance of chromosomes element 3 n=1 Tax=Chionoecetes opilio TaxID=41210 RepID=A0A8J5D3D4_CHIOP|nr:Non-structural maintenance of chromosomes element 3 [Chionoecetes opilio]
MSQRRKNKARYIESDESEYEDNTRSQSRSLTGRDVEKLAGQVCNMLLVGEMKKIPAKSADIRSIIQKKTKSSFENVMGRAGEIMQQVFGYEIKCVKGNSYILVNSMSATLLKFQQLSKKEEAEWGVLIVTLIAIFMCEGTMNAAQLEAYLGTLGIDMATKGKTMLKDFVRKKYLDTSMEGSSDPPTLMYQWGDRAHAEISKGDLLELVCKVYGNVMKPSMWTYQWKLINDNKEKEQ